jgi:hypothetical protein
MEDLHVSKDSRRKNVFRKAMTVIAAVGISMGAISVVAPAQVLAYPPPTVSPATPLPVATEQGFPVTTGNPPADRQSGFPRSPALIAGLGVLLAMVGSVALLKRRH